MALEDMHTAGLRICLEGTSWFSRCRPLQARGTAKIQGTLVASLEDGHFWICIHIQKKALTNESTKITSSIENIARLSTRDTLSLQWGVYWGVQVGEVGAPLLFPTFAIWVTV